MFSKTKLYKKRRDKRKEQEKILRRVYDVAADVYFYVVTEKS
jgi:hypothetical protein